MLKHIHNTLNVTLLLVLSVTMLLPSCKKEFNDANWDVDLLVPLVRATLTIDDLLPDSLTQYDSSGLATLVYSDLIYELSLDSLFELSDMVFESTAKLSTLNFGSIELVRSTSLGDIAEKDKDTNGPTGGMYEVVVTAYNTGQSATIGPIDQQEFMDVAMDASSYFQSMSLSQGTIDIIVENNLPIDVYDLIFELKNTVDGLVIIQDTFALILPGATATATKSLAGKTILGDLTGNIKISSHGSGVDVPIDTTDALVVRIRIRDIQLNSAVAVFPDQEVLNLSETAIIEPDDIELVQLIARQGIIRFTVSNTIQESILYSYNVPGATLNGTPLSVSGTVPAGSGAQAGQVTIDQEISGYSIDFRGIGPFEQISGDLNNNGIIDTDTVNSLYYKVSARIDSTGEYLALSQEDSIYIKTEFIGFIPDYAAGFLGQDTVNEISSIVTDFFTDFAAMYVKLEDVKVNLSIHNQLGIEAALNINEFIATNSFTENSSTLVFSSGQNPIFISQPNDPQDILTDVVPSISTLSLNAQNSNINELVQLLPDVISLGMQLFSNPSGGNSSQNFIYYGDKIEVYLDAEIPLSFSANNFTLIDTFDFHLDTADVLHVNHGNLNVFSDNYFPISSFVQIYLMRSDSIFDSLFSVPAIVIEGLITGGEDKVMVPQRTKITIPLSRAAIDDLLLTDAIRVRSDFATKPDHQYVKIYDSYSIIVTITTDFNYRIVP